MASHPVLLSLVAIAGLMYASGAYLMWQMQHARPGVEDENGFYFTDVGEDVVVPADEVRPEWFTGSLAARFSGQRAVIFAGAVPA